MSKQEYEFGTFSIDADRSVVLRAGEEISLRRQSFDVLMYLVERPGQLVTKDGLVAAIWGNTAVTDNSLMQCMAEIRKALGDDDHQIVRTVVRRGYLFEPPTVSVQTGTGSESSPVYRLARVIVAVAVVLSVVAALITYFETDDVDRLGDNSIAMHTAATLEQDPSIALLKFDNLSIDNADQSFIDGVREEIAKQLGGVKRLRVISPLSVDRASRNGLAMQALGETLDVDYVLRGVGRRVQDRFRLTVQLFDAATDAQTWQESYDVELTADGLLDVEYEIAVAVATMLGIKMMPDSYVSKSEHGPANVEALDRFYDGLYYLRKSEYGGLGPNALNVHLAIGRFEEAIAADNNWAPPHFGIARAMVYWTGEAYRGEPEYLERLDVAMEHAKRALEIDNRYVPALAVLAQTQIARDRDLAAARRTYQRIVNLGVKESHWLHAILLRHEQRFDESISEYLSTIDMLESEGKPALRPRHSLAISYLCAGRYRETIDLVNHLRTVVSDVEPRGLVSGGDSVWHAEARAYLKLGEQSKGLALTEALAREYGSDLPVAHLLALAGERERARQALREVEDPAEREFAYMFEAALELGEYELALDYLEASIPTFDPVRRLVHCDGRTDALAGNPRFSQILGEIGVPVLRGTQ